MAEPRRLIDALDDDFEREVLRSAQSDAPNDAAFRRTLVSMGVGLSVIPVAAAGAAPSAGALSAKLGAAVLAKWLVAGLALGAVAVGGVGLTQRALEHRSEYSTAVAQLAAAASVAERPSNTLGALPPGRVVLAPTSPPEEPVPAPPKVSLPHPFAKSDAEINGGVDAPTRALAPEPPPTGPASRSFEVETHETAVEKLERETKLLDLARSALGRGAAASALATLGDYERAFPAGALTPEARVLKVRALIAVGRRSEAEALAARVIAAAPRSEHADAVRALLAGRTNP